MHLLTPRCLAALRFNGIRAALLRTLFEYLGKQLYAAQSTEAGEGRSQIVVLEAAEAVAAPSWLKSQVIRNVTPQSRSEQEIAGYRDALAWISSWLMLPPMKSEGLIESTGKWLGAKWIQVLAAGQN